MGVLIDAYGKRVDHFRTQASYRVSFSSVNPWVITHNLGKYPEVTCIDASGNKVYGSVVYDSANQVTITFLGIFTGTAILN